MNSRVLKPNGEFLLEIVNPDIWVKVMMPIPHLGLNAHYRPDPTRWRAMLKVAGFEVIEEGTGPATLYWLARKQQAPPAAAAGPARCRFPAGLFDYVSERIDDHEDEYLRELRGQVCRGVPLL